MNQERSRYSDELINGALDALAEQFVKALPPGEATIDRQRWGVSLRHTEMHVYVSVWFEWDYDRSQAVISFRKHSGRGGKSYTRVGNPIEGWMDAKKIAKKAAELRSLAERTILAQRRYLAERQIQDQKQQALADLLRTVFGEPMDRDGRKLQWSGLNLSADLGLANYGAGFASFQVSVPTAYVTEFGSKFRALLEDILARPLVITPEAK